MKQTMLLTLQSISAFKKHANCISNFNRAFFYRHTIKRSQRADLTTLTRDELDELEHDACSNELFHTAGARTPARGSRDTLGTSRRARACRWPQGLNPDPPQLQDCRCGTLIGSGRWVVGSCRTGTNHLILACHRLATTGLPCLREQTTAKYFDITIV